MKKSKFDEEEFLRKADELHDIASDEACQRGAQEWDRINGWYP